MMTILSKSLRRCLALSVMALVATPAASQEGGEEEDGKNKVDYDLIFPDTKVPISVKPEDPNPFVALSDPKEKEGESSTEENFIKERILALKVVGASPRPNGYRVLLGDFWLEAGMTVPAFLPDQSVRLRVNAITEEGIEFVWQEKVATGLPPRTLFMPMNIKPEVRYLLPGQGVGEGEQGKGAAEPTFGVQTQLASQIRTSKPSSARPVGSSIPRAVPVEEEVAAKKVQRPQTEADSVLDMFFNQGGKLPEVR